MVDLRRSRPGRTWPVPLALFLACLAAAGCDGSRASDPPLLEDRAALAQTPGSSAIPGQPASAGWTSGSFMSVPRLSHTARRLTSGKVIVAGGITDAPAAAIPDPASYSVSSSTEIYDPQTNDWQFLPSMLDDRIEHAMVTQPLSQPPDGGVLVIGGRNDFNEILSSAEIFDGSFWQSKAQLLEARAGHTATRLSDARVLVVGGYNGGGIPTAGALGGDPGVPSSFVPLCSAEIFDPTAAGGLGAFVPTGALAQCRTSHAETLLTGDRVLVTGGEADGVPMASAEAWSPMSGTWTQLPPMSMPRTGHTATRLNNGLVLVVGGHNGVNDLKSAEVFDPIAIAWTTVGPMSAGRSRHTAVLLNDGRVLITGGYQDGSALSSAEIFDLVTKTFTPTAPMSEFRARHSATLLANGEVLVAGGDNLVGDPSITASAEIFSLSPGAGKPCDVAADCPDGFCVDGVCCDAACDQPCQACTQAARGGPGAPDGTCAPVVKGLDPADECAGTPAPGCGTTGVCDGVGACQLHPLGTECKPGACDGTTAQTTSTCDGKGVCISGAMQECAPFACIGGACLKGCKGPPDCAPTAFCDVAGNCKPKLPDGAVATDPVQCLSGFAIDGVCCDTACDQECQTCAKDLGAVANGVCSPLSGVQCDDGTACTQLDVCQSGQCVGMQPVNCPGDTGCQGGLACDPATGACTVPLPPKNPGDSCEDGDVCTEGDTCDAAGACAGGAVDCSPGECQSAGQCVPEIGCQFEPSPDFTECTKDDNPCTAEVCKSGVCLFNNNLDGVPCPGGTCFAGGCLPDSGGTTTGAGTGTGTGTGTGSGGDGGNGGPAGGGDPGAGGSGAGGAAAGGSGEGGYSLIGGACSTPAGGAGGPGLAGAALALLGLAGARRRRRGAR